MTKEKFIQTVSKINQTSEDEFKAEFNSPELLWSFLEKSFNLSGKKPKKNITLTEDYLEDYEDWFKSTDFNNPTEFALIFGSWLNLYFHPWSRKDSIWMDADNYAYTTEELLTEFTETYKSKNKDELVEQLFQETDLARLWCVGFLEKFDYDYIKTKEFLKHSFPNVVKP
jgi:hypothetical protein